jgi:hypothetical protein
MVLSIVCPPKNKTPLRGICCLEPYLRHQQLTNRCISAKLLPPIRCSIRSAGGKPCCLTCTAPRKLTPKRRLLSSFGAKPEQSRRRRIQWFKDILTWSKDFQGGYAHLLVREAKITPSDWIDLAGSGSNAMYCLVNHGYIRCGGRSPYACPNRIYRNCRLGF